MLPEQRDNFILETDIRVPERIRDQITKIPHMPLLIKRPPMRLAMRIEMRSSSDTAFGQIAELVNMDPMLAVGAETFHDHGNLHRGLKVLLAE